MKREKVLDATYTREGISHIRDTENSSPTKVLNMNSP